MTFQSASSIVIALLVLSGIVYGWYEIPSLLRGSVLSDLRLLVWASVSFVVLSIAYKFESR